MSESFQALSEASIDFGLLEFKLRYETSPILLFDVVLGFYGFRMLIFGVLWIQSNL